MFADTLLTVVFIVVLRRSRTGFRGYVSYSSDVPHADKENTRTDSTIDILVIYAINTGTSCSRTIEYDNERATRTGLITG